MVSFTRPFIFPFIHINCRLDAGQATLFSAARPSIRPTPWRAHRVPEHHQRPAGGQLQLDVIATPPLDLGFQHLAPAHGERQEVPFPLLADPQVLIRDLVAERDVEDRL